ncbi:DnaJ domain-containing protein, partial [Delphinella strobiligena]
MSSPLPPDPYVGLGVSKDADAAQIKSIYRKLVLKCHPDKVTDAAKKAEAADEFHRIQQAYEILSDEERRSRYD